jgi:hypothetical protein
MFLVEEKETDSSLSLRMTREAEQSVWGEETKIARIGVHSRFQKFVIEFFQ